MTIYNGALERHIRMIYDMLPRELIFLDWNGAHSGRYGGVEFDFMRYDLTEMAWRQRLHSDLYHGLNRL